MKVKYNRVSTLQQSGDRFGLDNGNYDLTLLDNPPSKNSYRKEMTLLSEVQVSLTENVKEKALQLIQKKWGELVHVASTPEANSGRISSSGIGLKFPTPRKCLVTGLDISMQKKESLFLYTTGVMYYHDHHPGTYKDLENRLSSKWDQESFEVRCREIAHSIRNEYHNRRKALLAKRSTRNDQGTLFSYVSLEDKSLMDQYGIAS